MASLGHNELIMWYLMCFQDYNFDAMERSFVIVMETGFAKYKLCVTWNKHVICQPYVTLHKWQAVK